MPDTEDIEELDKEAVKPSAKVGTARPIKVREIDAKAEELKKQRALPPRPAERVDFESLITWCKLLTPVMWEHILIYTYRWNPVIRREPKYIDVLSEMSQVNTNYMISKHGGGRYGFYVTDTDAPGSGKQVFEATLNVPIGTHDPILNYDELDRSCKENRSYIDNLKARRILDQDGNVVEKEKANMTPGMDSTGMIGVVKEVANLVKSLNADQQTQFRRQLDPEQSNLGKSIGDILLEKMKQDDPTKQMGMFTSLLAALKTIIPEPAKQDGGLKDIITIIMPLFTQLMQTQSENSKMMIEAIRETKNQSNKDPLDSIDKVLDVTAKIQEASGGGNFKRTNLEVILDTAKDVVPAVFSNLRDMLVLAKLGPQGVSALQPKPAPGQPQPVSQAQPQVSEGAPQMTESELVSALQQAKPILIKHLMEGTDGVAFADMLVGMFGMPAHAAIAKFGEEQILNVMKQIPDIYQPYVSTFGEDALKTWVHEFVHFREILEEEEKSDEIEEIDKAEGKERKKRKEKVQ